MWLFKIICFVILLIPATITLSLEEGQPFNNTEAQRYYDLAVSYIKSDLYEDGLKTLNQVAFLYPDSDVADNALYQLALIREQVGDGKINIGEKKSIDTVSEELARLNESKSNSDLAQILGTLNAYAKGQNVLAEYKSQAITQYILALDYLNTLIQRYPNSDRLEDTRNTIRRVALKIERTMNETPKANPKTESTGLGGQIFTGIAILIIIAITLRFANIY